jgi:NAD+ synthase
VKEIVDFIRQAIHHYEYNGALIGISGGIDSAVVAALCVKALGNKKVFGVLLPERDSAADTVSDAKSVCAALDIEYTVRPISHTLKSMGIYRLEHNFFFWPRRLKEKYTFKKWLAYAEDDNFLADLQQKGSREFLKGLAYYRSKHRIRMCYLYLEAEQQNYAVVGTTNLSELKTGFYVKYGDDAVDFEPIIHLYKTEVYELAKSLDIPEKIIWKPPSPDLLPGITDEFCLGMSYQQLDTILIKIDRGESLEYEDHDKVQRVKTILNAASKREVKMLTIHSTL